MSEIVTTRELDRNGDDGPAIEINQLSKLYRIGVAERAHDTLIGSMASWFRAPAGNLKRLRSLSHFDDDAAPDVLWALRDVSFEVARGEVVGIIGRNGAGKTTLLKILSQITSPTRGRASILGRVASLLEVGTGFHPELTGRENVYLNGSILGMSKSEIDSKFDAIAEFSGVERFLDTPVKRYSSGMQVRLAFSVAAHLEPEILIVDEVLAVGDAEFQAKCLGKMKSVTDQNERTVLFVSHNMAAVKKLCDRCVLLERGQVVMIGNTYDVIRRYLSAGAMTTRELSWEPGAEPGSDELKLLSVRVVDSHGEADSALATGDDIFVEVRYRINTDLTDLRIALALLNDEGVEIFVSSDFHEQGNRRQRQPGEYMSRCRIPGELLNTGKYAASIDAEIPRFSTFVQGVQVPFEIEELSNNSLGVTLASRPPGIIHPRLDWEVTRTDNFAGAQR